MAITATGVGMCTSQRKTSFAVIKGFGAPHFKPARRDVTFGALFRKKCRAELANMRSFMTSLASLLP